MSLPYPGDNWLSGFSLAHPEAHIDVVARLELGHKVAMYEVLIRGARGAWSASEVRRLPGVREVEILQAAEGSERLRVFFTGHTFLPVFRTVGLVAQMPVSVDAGIGHWTVVGSPERIRELLRRLDGLGLDGSRVESVAPFQREPHGAALTARQARVLRRAMELGYFEVPRRISLTRLASALDVAVSTMSETLATIEKKLVEEHLRNGTSDPTATRYGAPVGGRPGPTSSLLPN